MGDTYDRVTEIAKEALIREQCSFVYEYNYLFSDSFFHTNSIILHATILEEDEESKSAWEGKLGALKSHFGKQIKLVEEKVVNSMKAIGQMKIGAEKQAKVNEQFKASFDEL
jgi:hypothetical protein